MRSKKALIGSLGITILTFTCVETALAGWRLSSNIGFFLDIEMECSSPNYAGEWITNIVDEGVSTVTINYPATGESYTADQLVKCTGTALDENGNPEKDEDGNILRSTDFYSMSILYSVPDKPTSTNTCDDTDKGHGNDCPKSDPDNTGSSGPGKGGGSTSGIDSSVQSCVYQGTNDQGLETWLDAVEAYCEDSGATAEGHLIWYQDEEGNTNYYENRPFWLDPSNEEFFVCGNDGSNDDCSADIDLNGDGEPERVVGALDLSGFPMFTETTGKNKGVSFVDLDACSAFFPEETDFEPFPDSGFTARTIGERLVLLSEELYFDKNCTGEKEVLQAYNRFCQNDYKRDKDGNPIPCFYDPEGVIERKDLAGKQAVVDFSIVLKRSLDVAPETINVGCASDGGTDNGVVKATVFSELDDFGALVFNACRTAGVIVNDPAYCLPGAIVEPAIVSATDGTIVYADRAPRLIPFREGGPDDPLNNELNNDPRNSLYELPEYIKSVPIDKTKIPEIGDFDGDGYYDLRFAYQSCTSDDDGFAQIVTDKSLGTDGTVDIQMVGKTRTPGKICEADDVECLQQEFEEGSSFRTRDLDHSITKYRPSTE